VDERDVGRLLDSDDDLRFADPRVADAVDALLAAER